MNEPLVCWLALLALATWGAYSTRDPVQKCLVRTVHDIVKYDYLRYHFLSWATYSPNCADVPQVVWDAHVVGLPDFLRVISLLSPIAGLAALVIVLVHVIKFIRFSQKYTGEEYAKWVCDPKVSMPMLVIGMPMVFTVMALRATIRQWAIMTCSAWFAFHRDNPTMTWKEVKALELATYEQDLAVANAFQFIAVWCFGMACTHALENMVVSESSRQSDKTALMHAGILGVHAFVVIGLVRAIIHVFLAACSSNTDWAESIIGIQALLAAKVDPMFLFATVLCVINMFILGSMDEVKRVLGNVNMKFNATRALLLIGQGQMMILTAATTANPSYAKIMNFLHMLPGLENLSWRFNLDQARLFHASLLCFECLIIAIVNLKLWKPEPVMDDNTRTAPLLEKNERPEVMTAQMEVFGLREKLERSEKKLAELRGQQSV